MYFGEENRLGIKLLFEGKKLKEVKGRIFNLLLFENEFLGRALVLEENNEKTLQVSENLDFYDEILAHVALNSHEKPEKVLILGGGDLKIASEAMVYGPERIVVVDIAEEVVKISRNFSWWKEASEKVEIINRDACEFLEENSQKFDVIIGDFTDPYPDQASSCLISKETFENVKKAMKKDSIFAFQSGSPIFQKEILLKAWENAIKVFGEVKLFWAPVPIYPLCIWTFIFVGKSNEPKREITRSFYSPEIHRTCFILPPFIRALLSGSHRN